MTDICYLITVTESVDDLGMVTKTETRKKVFCDVMSISQGEFFQAFNASLKPDCKFIVFTGDYNGERLLKAWGDYYTIYRTYKAGDRVELYAEKRIGNRE